MFAILFLLLAACIQPHRAYAFASSSSTPQLVKPASTIKDDVTLFATTTANSIARPATLDARATSTQPCNNYIEFCTRSYGNITEVCAHDSPFHVANNIASDQAYDVVTQLNDGIRMLQGQTHMLNGSLHFCHTSCELLDAGTVEAYFSNVSAWLQYHPNEVITILIVNGDNSPVMDYVQPIQSSGLGRYVYTPPEIPMRLDDWSTLGTLIDANTRVILFMDAGANQTEVPYVLDEFSQLWETTFSPTNASFPCAVQRPSNLSNKDAQNMLYMANHNLDVPLAPAYPNILIPDLPDINRTNGVSGFGSLGLAAENCVAMWNRPPNFLLVDYYNDGSPAPGSVFEVAASINGVSYTRSCCGSNTETSSAVPSSTSRSPSMSSTSIIPANGASRACFNTILLFITYSLFFMMVGS